MAKKKSASVREPRQARSLRTQERLLDAMESLLQEHDPADITVEDIVERTARGHRPLRLCVEGSGVFGGRRSPRVLWLGVGGELEALRALHAELTSALEEAEAQARAEIDAASERVLQAGMADPDPVYLSTLRIDAPAFAALHPEVEMDAEGVRVLRSVLMKPEHESHVPWLHERVTAISRR